MYCLERHVGHARAHPTLSQVFADAVRAALGPSEHGRLACAVLEDVREGVALPLDEEVIGSMLEEIDRMSSLVDTLLRLSHGDTGTIRLSRGPSISINLPETSPPLWAFLPQSAIRRSPNAHSRVA